MIYLIVALFIPTFVYIYKRDIVFSVYYSLLFIYTIFTELSYLYYPDILSLQGIPLGSVSDFLDYQLFVRASLLAVFLVYASLHYSHTVYLRPVVRTKHSHYILFYVIVFLFDIVLLAFYLLYKDSLSYQQQSVLKENGLFRNMFVFSNTLFIVLYAVTRLPMRPPRKFLHYFLMSFLLLDILLVAAKAGSRGFLLFLPLGLLVFTLVFSKAKSRHMRFWFRLVFSASLLLYLAVSLQVLRRNSDLSLYGYLVAITEPKQLFQDYLFSPVGLLFQDYTGPSLLLLYSIQAHLVQPFEALSSVFLGALPLSGSPSLGYLLARRINPDLQYSWQGFGYYFLTEGFTVAGWFGILYNATVLNMGYWLWSRIFINVRDHTLRATLAALVAMQALDIVRSQSSTFVRGALYSLIPALLLYYLGTGVRPRYCLSTSLRPPHP